MMEKRLKSKAGLLSFAVILILLVTSVLTGCKSDTEDQSGGDVAIFSDDAGRQVELPEDIEHVATLGTTGQIMMLSLAPDLMVGINAPIERDMDQYIDFDVSSLPEIGQYYGQRNLNLEELSSLEVDVIIDLGDTKKNAAEDMDEIQEQSGIPTIHINSTMDTAPDAFRRLGALLDRQERAEELASCCENIYDKTMSVLDQVSDDDKADLLSCSGSDGTTVVVKGSSHSELLDLVGNNMADVTGNNSVVSIEQIHVWNPDVILFSDGSIYDMAADLPDWQGLQAIENDHYYEIPNGPYCWTGSPPTVNRYLGLLWLTATLYPEECDYDLQEEVTEYYRVFYGCDLTDTQYQSLTQKSGGAQ